jgi:hypothetical protein
MSNWSKLELAYDSDNPEAEAKHAKKLAEKNKKAERDAALKKAYKYYEYTKIHHTDNIIKIRAAARAFIDVLKHYEDNKSNAGTIKAIHEYIIDDLNRNFLKNLNSNAKGLAAAKATRKKHNNIQNYLLYTS